jgi:hypothetical protein
MTSDPEGNSAGDAVNPEENEPAAEAKPKARKKKAVDVVGAAEPASEAAPEEAEVKPAKKKTAAKKAKPAIAAEETPVEAAPSEAAPKKKAAKPAKKDKGRDLVVDEPGAQEVAEVLHTSVAPAEMPKAARRRRGSSRKRFPAQTRGESGAAAEDSGQGWNFFAAQG